MIFKETGDNTSSYFSVINSDVYNAGVRRLIEETYKEMGDKDGNFVEQFRTTGFNQRLTELYTFQVLNELGCKFNNEYSVPDFMVSKNEEEICIEVTTANIGNLKVDSYVTLNPDEQEEYLRDYVPIRVGSALISKVAKKYWLSSHCKGKPFIILIQLFFDDSVFISPTYIHNYLYGYSESGILDKTEGLIINRQDIEKHTFKHKIIESGFFDLEESNNVSAVIYTNAGTIPKFRRMSYQLGYKMMEPMSMTRTGKTYSSNPEALYPDETSIDLKKYFYRNSEKWKDEFNVFHNPNATHPINDEFFKGAIQHRYENGESIASMSFSRPRFISSMLKSKNYPIDINKYSSLEFMMKVDFYKLLIHNQGYYDEIMWIKLLKYTDLYSTCVLDPNDDDYSCVIFKRVEKTMEPFKIEVNFPSLNEVLEYLDAFKL